jgi:hypothetical protein
MISEIFKKLEYLVNERRISDKERRMLEGQEIEVEESFKILRGC